MNTNNRRSVNVLSLDGGGVRGLSTLIILRVLLCLVNQKLNPTNHNGTPIHPSKVFDLIVGTSTGGLIALMMVKFDMSVDECIEKYKELSQKIFRQWHVLGYASGGFGAVTKFSSRNLRKVLVENVIRPGLESRGIKPEEYLMEQIESHPNVMCSVVCNELYQTTRERIPDAAVFICSHWNNSDSGAERPLVCTRGCRISNNRDRVPVIDAARATSAAPTYFKHVEMLGSLLVDGGFGLTNNPSHAAYEHYFWGPSRPLNYHYIRMVNIGTGTRPRGWQPKKSFIHRLPYFRGAASVISGLAKIATDSENVGKIMHGMADLSSDSDSGILKFDRFSADCGEIHQINLYEHGAIATLERITEDYLRKAEVMRRLDEFAEELAQTCRSRQGQGQPATIGDHRVVFSEITEDETGTQVTPQIILSQPSDDEVQQIEAHNEHGAAPGSPPELTDASSRGSFDTPPTPIGSTRPVKSDAYNFLATASSRVFRRRSQQRPGTSGLDSTTFP